jgi:hypothetical protein
VHVAKRPVARLESDERAGVLRRINSVELPSNAKNETGVPQRKSWLNSLVAQQWLDAAAQPTPVAQQPPGVAQRSSAAQLPSCPEGSQHRPSNPAKGLWLPPSHPDVTPVDFPKSALPGEQPVG